jgi:hypothetical protein
VKNPSKVVVIKTPASICATKRSLTYEYKDYAVKEPKKIGLPAINMSSSYILQK